jgi:cyclopropane-fatty-acyl-phospholipid synthase
MAVQVRENGFADAVRLTAENFSDAVRGLPSKARLALAAGMKLACGSLDVRLPDGRAFRLGGNAPGPDASLIMKNWKLPMRALGGGSIGVAESYMDGDWESPDVTTFLELFVSSSTARPARSSRAEIAC